MVTFKAIILQFKEQGEKTGWSYIEVPASVAARLKPGNKKSFRVKGFLDTHPIEGVSLLPMGEGTFIMPVNQAMRKGTGKGKGATLQVRFEVDERALVICPDLVESLQYEPKALAFFNKLPPGHRRYFSNWIDSARTEPTRVKRIAQTVNAMARGLDFGGMLRALREEKDRGRA